MNVLIVGAGNMGRGIATRLAAANAKLTIYDIDRAKAQAIATEVGGQVANSAIEADGCSGTARSS